jgi:aspartyl-tRNA(Asn)/glutamyl-tRNA(Gln) amidotransferase subunit A
LFTYSSIRSYLQALKDGNTTCEEAVLHYIDRIRKHASLNAFVSVYEEEAILRAKQLDNSRKEGRPMGKLHGVVISIKDVISYKGHPLRACSRILEDYVPIYHATAVERLLEEEAIIIGHTNCDEFAMGSSNEHSAYGKSSGGVFGRGGSSRSNGLLHG